MKFKKRLWICVCALFLSVILFGAFAEEEDSMRYVQLSEAAFSFYYTPNAGGNHSVCVFSADGEDVSADVEVAENGNIIAQGSGRGTVCTASLEADVCYTVSVTGSGKAAVEVARNALSRCHDDPLAIEENKSKSKMITRPGDAHWYRFTAADSSFVLLSGVPEDPDIDLGALLMDDSGNLISEFEQLPGGACILRAETEAGRDYYIRLYSPGRNIGYYDLTVYRPTGEIMTDNPAFDDTQYTVSLNHTLDMNSCLSGTAYLYTVSDTDICTVTPDGVITGLREGTAVVTAHGFSTQAQCEITVVNIPVESIDILGEKVTIQVGDDADIPVSVLPENASFSLPIFTVEDRDIASVSDAGVVTGLKAGTTVLHAASPDGSVSDTAEIIVEEAPIRYRALLVGEENYPDTVNETRPGTQTALDALASALGTMEIGSERYAVSVRTDLSGTEFSAALGETFSRATEKDVSLIYISCHGEYFSGTCCMQFTDGSLYTAWMLERELRNIPGKIVLMIDCCAAGGAIGTGSGTDLYTKSMGDDFSSNIFPSSKYLVLCSTTLNRDSYRFSADDSGGIMSTVFARALCDALGWDMAARVRSNMAADLNSDSCITFGELFEYVRDRVNVYMDNVGSNTGNVYIQEVCANAHGSPVSLFERTRANGEDA